MARTHVLDLELVGDLDAVARLVTVLRKCRAKAEVREMHVVLRDGIIHVKLLVETDEINWLVNKLNTIYELQEVITSTPSQD